MDDNGVWHLALDMESARTLFGRRDPVALGDFLGELLASEERRSEGRNLPGHPEWLQMSDDEVIRDAGIDPEIWRMATCGGRPLAAAHCQAYLVRPDMVPHVAQVLGEVDPAGVTAAFQKPRRPGFERFPDWYRQLCEFFARAAERGDAVLFVVPHGDELPPPDEKSSTP